MGQIQAVFWNRDRVISKLAWLEASQRARRQSRRSGQNCGRRPDDLEPMSWPVLIMIVLGFRQGRLRSHSQVQEQVESELNYGLNPSTTENPSMLRTSKPIRVLLEDFSNHENSSKRCRPRELVQSPPQSESQDSRRHSRSTNQTLASTT